MKALVLAGGLPQIELIQQLRARGVLAILADGSAAPLALEYADRFYQVNIFDIEAVKNIAVSEHVDFLITCCADQVLLVVAQVSEMLGLPCYIDYETAKNVSDKLLMKRIFRDNGIPSSRYVETNTLDWSQIEDLSYPMVVKPVDAYSSKGVRKVSNREELERCWQEAAQISRSGGVIVEEFCDGEELSVDVYVEGKEAKVLCISNSEKLRDEDRFIIFRGRYPANVSTQITEKIRQVSQKIAEAFGISDAPMLIQMISDGENVSVLEFCARTGGNMKYLLIRRVCGFDVVRAVIDLAMGEKPHVELSAPSHKYIVNEFVYGRPGVFDHLEGFEELVREGSLADYHAIRPRGMQIRGVTSSSDRIAGFTIQADSLEEYNRKHRRVLELARVLDDRGQDLMRRDLLPELQ